MDEKGIGDLANEEASMRLSQFDPQIVLVAFGHPKQELWIEQHKTDYPSLKAIMGVGGTFDYWSGAVKRAPRWMRQVGLEWLWRVFIEPKRIKRILMR
ncbi:MAG: WecB/TagA/CpsF family glycosyltransferase [Candidatus Nomurabacteria bacterium]|nr:MAG: WecB/TagA/CpsF family glycosyltransferase [Candidatus Nomurabacteria bacterium]